MLLILIPLIISLLEMFIVHNCKHYNGDPFKLPLIIWLLWLILSIIPIVNIVLVVIVGVILICNLGEGDLELLYNNHWLLKKY